MDLGKFDLVVVNRHDELTGPNVVVTRTALHRATPERLAAGRAATGPAASPTCRGRWSSVLVGGSNGRFRLDAPVGRGAGAPSSPSMMRRDRVGVAITPSRRTDPAVDPALARRLEPLGAWIWDMDGENPYFGMLALADAIVVTVDSVSMVSEAAATAAPVLLAPLPGRSRRIGLFPTSWCRTAGSAGSTGGCEMWPVAPLDDTPEAAAAVRRRSGFEARFVRR